MVRALVGGVPDAEALGHARQEFVCILIFWSANSSPHQRQLYGCTHTVVVYASPARWLGSSQARENKGDQPRYAQHVPMYERTCEHSTSTRRPRGAPSTRRRRPARPPRPPNTRSPQRRRRPRPRPARRSPSPPAPRPLRTRCRAAPRTARAARSEEHTSELQSQSTTSYAVLCLKKKKKKKTNQL